MYLISPLNRGSGWSNNIIAINTVIVWFFYLILTFNGMIALLCISHLLCVKFQMYTQFGFSTGSFYHPN